MSAFEIVEQWPEAVQGNRIRVLDGGRLSPSEPSTVVDCMGARPRVIRPGAIPAAVLRESLPALIGDR
jgi:L-threonylcarbamoyladenylate synthase